MAADRQAKRVETEVDRERLAALRRKVQLVLWVIVVITIVGGLFYPLLGFVVPIVMFMGIIGGLFRGRYVCGWLCPRGAFLDRILRPLSPGREIPAHLRGRIFRWVVFALLVGFMIWQISLDPGDVYHWGRVFVRMCIITTAIGVVLALFVHPRTWCSFCPMGTLQSAVGGSRAPLKIDDGCIECRACERACPMNLEIVGKAVNGELRLPDCLKCPECQLACPKKVLHF
jgi:polyferredoxin